MKMTQEEYENFSEEYAGYCSKCDDITTYEVEPDAEGYECEQCQNHSVMGMENALILEKILITDDDEDYDDDDGFHDEDDEN